MYCPSCGNAATTVMICGQCRRFMPAFWLDLFSAALWAVVGAMNYFLLWIWMPPMAALYASFGADLPLAMRVYLGLVRPAAVAAIVLFVLTIPLPLLATPKRLRWLQFLKSGRAWALVTFAAVVFSTLGLFTGMLCYNAMVARVAP